MLKNDSEFLTSANERSWEWTMHVPRNRPTTSGPRFGWRANVCILHSKIRPGLIVVPKMADLPPTHPSEQTTQGRTAFSNAIAMLLGDVFRAFARPNCHWRIRHSFTTDSTPWTLNPTHRRTPVQTWVFSYCASKKSYFSPQCI